MDLSDMAAAAFSRRDVSGSRYTTHARLPRREGIVFFAAGFGSAAACRGVRQGAFRHTASIAHRYRSAISRAAGDAGSLVERGQGYRDGSEDVRGPPRSSTLGSGTPTARASSRTRPKPCAGTGWPPSRASPARSSTLGGASRPPR